MSSREQGTQEAMSCQKIQRDRERGKTREVPWNARDGGEGDMDIHTRIGSQHPRVRVQNKLPHQHMSAREQETQEIMGCQKIHESREGGKTQEVTGNISDGREGDPDIHTRTGSQYLRVRAQNKLPHPHMGMREQGTQENTGWKKVQKNREGENM